MIKYSKTYFCDRCGVNIVEPEEAMCKIHVSVDACGEIFSYRKEYCTKCKYAGIEDFRHQLESIGFIPPYEINIDDPNEVRIKNADLPPEGFERMYLT